MRETWKVSAGIFLVAMAVLAAAATPALAQRGGRRGGGLSGEGFRGPRGGMEGFRGRGGPFGERGGPGGGMEGFRGRGGPFGERGGPGGGREGFRGRGGPFGDRGGPGGDREGFRGRGGPPSRGDRGPFGGDDGGERFEQFLRSMDADGDGRLEENEVDGRRRFFVEMMARRAGIEPEFPISVRRFRDAMARARENRENEDSSSGRSGSSDGKDEEPLVPGFGVELDLPALLEFGQRPPDDTTSAANSSSRSDSRRSRGSSSRGSSSRGSSSRGEPDERIRRWAEAMMRQQDRNGNGRLERDEWNERWGDFREADRNRDGAVRPDELTRRLAEFSQNRSGWDRSRSDRSSDPRSRRLDSSESSGSDSDSNDSNGPKSYRLLTPLERLPEGLPGWFAQKDTNADGQVAMSEYEPSGFWTAAAVDRFAGFDLNRDGMITAGECLEALKQSEAGSEVAAAGAPGQLARANGARPGPGRGPGRPGSGRPSSSTSTTGSDSGGVWEGF